MHLQLDLLGGLAGDMFIAAVLDAFPEHTAGLQAVCERLAPTFGHAAGGIRLVAFRDGVFQGRRFVVDGEGDRPAGSAPAPRRPHEHGPAHSQPHSDGHETGRDRERDTGHSHEHETAHGHEDSHPHSHEHEQSHEHEHEHEHADSHSQQRQHAHPPSADPASHVAWSDIRTRLEHHLAPGVLRHALGIFGALADAEAQVHGVAVDAVEFHEVGAWDSVVDIVGAAWLIDVLDARSWQVGAVPLGSGRVRTAHGPMPVPTPATALLLRGFTTIDDGIAGERVTPTGAAILKYLVTESPAATGRPRVLRRSGVGFGSRRLDGISNCVRVLAFDDAAAAAPAPAHRELAVVEFEVDDQSAEELAIGLDRLRAHPGVFDAVQAPVFGKKGRMMTSIRLLASPAALDDVLDACFRETTTIGLRHTTVKGRALPRRSDEVVVDGHRVRVKTVERPGGATAKAESDDALAHETHQARRRIRHAAEQQVLDAARKASDV